MPEANSQQKSKTHGEVRIRSNVCTDPHAWHLVPGDVIKSFSLPRDRLTQKQKDEMLYYARCCICRRTIFEIEEDGCDNSVCRQQGIPSFADAKRRRKDCLDNAESAQGRQEEERCRTTSSSGRLSATAERSVRPLSFSKDVFIHRQ